MSREQNQTDNLYGAGTGRQAKVAGGGTVATLGSVTLLQSVAQAASTTYYYRLPCAGAALLQVTLKPGTVTGTCSGEVYKTLCDGVTQKGTAVALTAFTSDQQDTTQIALCGERCCILKIVIAAASNLTFSVAEFNTL